jgi:hypothetical protein
MLRMRRSLEMKPAQSFGGARQGMIILHEPMVETDGDQPSFAIGFRKPSAIVAKTPRRDDSDRIG